MFIAILIIVMATIGFVLSIVNAYYLRKHCKKDKELDSKEEKENV